MIVHYGLDHNTSIRHVKYIHEYIFMHIYILSMHIIKELAISPISYISLYLNWFLVRFLKHSGPHSCRLKCIRRWFIHNPGPGYIVYRVLKPILRLRCSASWHCLQRKLIICIIGTYFVNKEVNESCDATLIHSRPNQKNSSGCKLLHSIQGCSDNKNRLCISCSLSALWNNYTYTNMSISFVCSISSVGVVSPHARRTQQLRQSTLTLWLINCAPPRCPSNLFWPTWIILKQTAHNRVKNGSNLVSNL